MVERHIREVEGKRPHLSLSTAVPDMIPIGIGPQENEEDRPKYDMRPIASYSTKERKRLQSLLVAVVEYDASDEDEVTHEDTEAYLRALRQIVDIAMPNLPEHVHAEMTYMHHGMIANYVYELFRSNRSRPDDAGVPESDEPRKIKPSRLRKLQKRLNSPTPLRLSSDSTEATQASG